MVEAREVKPGVYVGRTLLAPEHRGQKVNVVNTKEAPTVLKSGTWLGNLRPVKVISYPEESQGQQTMWAQYNICLLYTSDAADE